MNLNSSVKMGGRFSVGVVEPLTDEVTSQTPWVSNLVLDTAETFIYNGFSSDKGFTIGSSADPLASTQTTTISPLGFEFISESVAPDSTVESVLATDGVSEIHVKGSSVFRIKTTEAGTINEIALTNFCRALVIDETSGLNGLPVDADVTLDITYEFTMIYRVTRRNVLTLEGVAATTDGIDHFTDSTLALIATPARLANPIAYRWDSLLSTDLVFKITDTLSVDENVFDDATAVNADSVVNNVTSRVGTFVDPALSPIRSFYFGNGSFGVNYVLVETATDNSVGLVLDSGDQLALTTTFNWIH